MRCPFLREEQVRSCQASPFRKPIARRAAAGGEELCTSADYPTCRFAPAHHEARPEVSRCPFLLESLVQYCSAAPATRYVPWSEASVTRCGHDGHRFCETFLATTGGLGYGTPGREHARIARVDGLAVPGWLLFTPNHMWLDVGDDGLCHVGIDAFLGRLLGGATQLVFVTTKGMVRPSVVVTAGGVDLTLSFPHAMTVVSTNARLRSSLGTLTVDPYGSGWLFEGRMESSCDDMVLFTGDGAREWMSSEVARLTRFVHDEVLVRREAAADGGAATADLLSHLRRDEIIRLFGAFFSDGPWRRS